MTSSFGTLPDGDAVTCVQISAGRLRATILSWGATLQDLRFDLADNRSDIPLVLGFDSMDDYLVHGRFHGATVGRVINRIGGASAVIDGRHRRLDSNSDGGSCWARCFGSSAINVVAEHIQHGFSRQRC